MTCSINAPLRRNGRPVRQGTPWSLSWARLVAIGALASVALSLGGCGACANALPERHADDIRGPVAPEDWVAFPGTDDGTPMVFWVNRLAVRDPRRPRAVRVKLMISAPTAYGMPTEEELDRLVPVEKELEKAAARAGAVFVGRMTGDGARYGYFYEAADARFEFVAEEILERAEIRGDVRFQHDPDWTMQEGLLPGPGELLYIRNREVSRALAEAGDDLTKPRVVDHSAYFPTEAGRNAFVEIAVREGFEPAGVSLDAPGPRQYGAHVTREDSLVEPAIDDASALLLQAAKASGGEYDGWVSATVK